MALLLLQRHYCVSHCSASAVTFTAPTTLQSTPRAAVVHVQPPKRFPICCASSQNTSSADVVLPREQNAAQAPIVFKDDSNGVVCYHDENGDVTCEGWDEGPHFEPDLQQPTLRRRRRFTPSAVQGRSGGESVNFENVEGRMGDSLGKEANESLESSEL